MNINTIKCFGESIAHGDKYIYQTVPRLLTLWLDMGEYHKENEQHKPTRRATAFLVKHIREVPAYKVLFLLISQVICLHIFSSGIQHSHKLFLVSGIQTTSSGLYCKD
jgi:hypothetical protein